MKHSIFLLILNLLILNVSNAQVETDTTFIDITRDTLLNTSGSSLDTAMNMPDTFCISFVCDFSHATIYFVNGFEVSLSEYQEWSYKSSFRFSLLENTNERKYPLYELRKLPVRKVDDITSLTAGVQLTSSGLSFKGSRENGTAYYLDGMRLINPILYVSNELLLK